MSVIVIFAAVVGGLAAYWCLEHIMLLRHLDRPPIHVPTPLFRHRNITRR